MAVSPRLRRDWRRARCLFSGDREDQIGAGAELAGAGEAAVGEFGGELSPRSLERSGQQDDRIETRHLEVDRLACRVRSGFQLVRPGGCR